MKILSIQSSVAYGHVGNSAAVFPLQRLGHEVWPVLTVHFSNHTGYGAWRGPLLDPADVREVIAGIGDRGVLGECDAVLSGYQGDPAVGAVILDAVATVKAANPAAVYCCDPVMGDVGRGMFVRPGIPEFMRDTVVPQADILTPNHFELDFLAGATTTTLDEVLAAVDTVRDRGPARRAGDLGAARRRPPGLAGRRRGLRRGRLGGHHSPAPDHAQRVRRRHRRALPRAPDHHGLARDGTGADHGVGVRRARGDAGGRQPRDPAGRSPGRDRRPAGDLPGPAAALTVTTFDLGAVPTVLDLAGTFVFAVSGALVAVRARLDLFGTLVLAGATGLGGGLVRDVLLGDVPPPGLVEWKFLVVAALAGVATFLWHPVVARWENLILTLDAAGLALFCVIGALKASNAGLDIVPAALLGMITGVGGGIARDVLANRVPVVLEGGWYATPALVGAAWAAFAQDQGWSTAAVLLPGIAVCFTWRALALHRDWSPRPARGV